MILRWLHKSWKYLWGFILALLVAVLLIGGGLLGILQLEATQDYLLNRIEDRVARNYKNELKIGDLDGFLPFNIQLREVVLLSADSARSDTLAKVQSIQNQIDIWQLLQNKVSLTGFVITRPEVWLRKENGKITFLEREKIAPDTTVAQAEEEPWLSQIEILAPQMSITNGTLHLQNIATGSQTIKLPPSVTIQNLNANFFLEWTEQQRYLDIESITAQTNDLAFDRFSMTGQIYSDQRFLEFNSFYLNFGRSEVIINGQIDGLNLGQPNLADQFLAAHYDLDVRAPAWYPQTFHRMIPAIPPVEGPLTFQLFTRGTTDSLQVNEISISKGQSRFRLNGLLQNLQQRDAFSYRVRVDSVALYKEDIRLLHDTLNTSRSQILNGLAMKGSVSGTLDSVNVDVALRSPLGALYVQGRTQLESPYQYEGRLRGRNVDLGWLETTAIDTTSLTFRGEISGSGFTMGKATSDFDITFEDGRINRQTFDQLQLSSFLYHGRWSHAYSYRAGEQQISGSGKIDFSRPKPPVSLQGKAKNIHLAEVLGDTSMASTRLNFDYNVEAEGLDPNTIEGRASIDIAPSVIGGDSVQAHQLYADIHTSGKEERAIRLTSSLFDMTLRGQLYPREMMTQTRYWSDYLQERYRAEIAIDSTAQIGSTPEPPSEPLVLSGSLKAKNISLIRKYMPSFPAIYTQSHLNFNVNSDSTRLLLSAELQADSLMYNQWKLKNGQTQLTASFRSDQSLKEFSAVDFRADVAHIRSRSVDMDSVAIDFAFKQDSIHYSQAISNIGKDARFNLEGRGTLTDSSVVATISDFYLGNNNYAWVNQATPILRFMRGDRVVFDNFSFQNNDQYFRLQGALSASTEDSLAYTLRDINLARISELIKGEINFGGILNGQLVTRSLTRQPTIQGQLDVSRFTLNNRIVGDVTFNSTYNPDKDRFDTKLEVFTDPDKYQAYLKANDGAQQHIVLDGYFRTSDNAARQDSLYYFDADFKQIDMWAISLLVDNIFQQMEGRAVGDGYISGNFQQFDFHADFQAQSVFVKPRFVNTNFFINGPVSVDRTKGVTLDSLTVMDTKGGTGMLWGNIDLNDFKPIKYLDLSLAMNNLQFMNNSMDPDVPFFGNISGTGTVRLTGSNQDLYMRTENTIELTNNSRVSIPLLEETELNETSQFIRFVDSFENRGQTSGPSGDNPDAATEAIQQKLEELTFSERFNLDLRFSTNNNIAVNLIFDPVTGEELNARGSGQLRITMQDQEVRMFGRYQIDRGTYQFVTGQIISRKLELQPGGTIVWEGPPDNARLDITAVYHARPDITTLTTEGSLGGEDQTSQQVPINLVVHITGTLNSVKNEYFFRLPNSLDLTSNSTLTYTINQINRDEQQKLLQATSILFTGQFIPTQGAGSATASLSQNLTRSSTVLNPLLSNQVISPLLSSQINALLNSDVSQLDIDFNLNAYNEVDLGIALRLYNDRLILRREGQITGGGPQTTLGDRIGDLNATYRISRRLSLTAFHRQNQILSNFSGQSQTADISPSVDGIGLEAHFQFNKWQQLWNQIMGISATPARKKEQDKQQNQQNGQAVEPAEEQSEH